MNKIAPTPLQGRSDGVECFFPVAPVSRGGSGRHRGADGVHNTSGDVANGSRFALIGIGGGAYFAAEFIPVHGDTNVK